MSLPQLILQRLDGTAYPLTQLTNKVILVVNVASRCGFTAQYAGLEALYRELGPKGFVILGFPCNQFGNQEPGDADEIARFCSVDYPVSFPIMSKCDVNGEHVHPLYQWLKQEKSGVLGSSSIKWNFTKFLIDQKGNVVDRFAPQTKPENLTEQIRLML
ncbi:MAG: glutathione peroxidase [Aeromonas sp.]